MPLRIASSTRAWCRLRRINERITMAPDTPRRRTSVARNVYKYNELELWRVGPLLLDEDVSDGVADRDDGVN